MLKQFMCVVHTSISGTWENGQDSRVCYGVDLMSHSIFAFQSCLPNHINNRYLFITVLYPVEAWIDIPVALWYHVSLFREGICGISRSSIYQFHDEKRGVFDVIYIGTTKQHETRDWIRAIPASNGCRVNSETTWLSCRINGERWNTP